MKFAGRLAELLRNYKNNFAAQRNGTLVLGPSETLYCEHLLFQELSDKDIQMHLVPCWEGDFPTALVELLKIANGAKLFNVHLNCGDFTMTSSMLIILGLPRTPPFRRPKDMEEPFDIRVENLHNFAPSSWLKFASYIPNFDFHARRNLFVDRHTGKVYACHANEAEVLQEWDSIDQCLCEIYDALKGCGLHYDY